MKITATKEQKKREAEEDGVTAEEFKLLRARRCQEFPIWSRYGCGAGLCR